MPYIRGTLTMLCLVLVFLLPANLIAADKFLESGAISQTSKIEISSGKITGLYADFSFTIPAQWKEYVFAEREDGSEAGLVEKINFYCNALSEIYKPKLIMTLFVFDRGKWSDTSRYEPIMKSKDYVFAYVLGSKDTFALEADRAIFNSCYKVVSSLSGVKRLIVLPEGQQETLEYTAIVNGESMYNKVKIIERVYYLPLRDVCLALGYNISWDGKESSIEITRGDFYDKFVISTDKNHDYRGIKMMIIDGRTYISTAYFVKVMGKSIDIDDRKNVYIISE